MRLIPADVRQAARRLIATPSLSIGAVLILSLGIGSAVVMADVLDRLLLRAPAHVTDPDRVSRIYIGIGAPVSYIDRLDYTTFEALEGLRDELEASAVFSSESLSLGRGLQTRRLEAVVHSPNYFAALGVQPFIGSWTDSANPTREDTAVISYGLWRQEFGASGDVLGKPLRLGLDTYTIVGVTPRGFAGIGFKAADVWLPLVHRASFSHGPQWKTHALFLQGIARLRTGVTRERANERATAAYRATRTLQWEKKSTVVLGDLRPARAPGARLQTRVEVLVGGMSLLVLLLTCGNVANILLVRGLRRDREFVVKTALGASRAHLLREVVLEAALLAGAAGIAALLVVTMGSTLMRREFLAPIAALASPLDARLVFVTFIFCVAAAFLLGVMPAFKLTTQGALRPGQSGLVRPSRILDLFSGLQVALCLPMIVAAALFVLSLWNARHQDFGIQTDRIAVVTTNLFELGRPMENHDVHRKLQARLAQLPQVESTALVQTLPTPDGTSFSTFPIVIPGKDPAGPVMVDNTTPLLNGVDPSFFTTMGMRLIDGRFFTDDENRKGARSVAVITQSMAQGIWPGERVIGKCFHMWAKEAPCTEVIGVVRDARVMPSIRPTKDFAATYYMPIEQASTSSQRALVVRTSGDPGDVLQTIRREAQGAAADLPYVQAFAFDEVYRSMLRPWRLGTVVFVVFGALSVVIAGVGLAIVGAYSVARRTREIGIRSALGAQPYALVRLMLARSLVVVAVGLAIGLALAWVGGRVLNAHLFDVTAHDPRVLGGALLTLLTIGGAAAWVPARRAARIDPVVALRTE